jgi:hypothetical protein
VAGAVRLVFSVGPAEFDHLDLRDLSEDVIDLRMLSKDEFRPLVRQFFNLRGGLQEEQICKAESYVDLGAKWNMKDLEILYEWASRK